MNASTEHQDEINTLIQQHGSVPPPWFMFPKVHPYDICWRMGTGESYIMVYFSWWEHGKQELDEKQRIEYFRKWPPPPEWLVWMIEVIWDLDPGKFENEDDYRPYFRLTAALGFGSEDDYKNAIEDEEETAGENETQ
ncbi:hypothetical protein FLONG3_592 [Fusarium longipes]|uniref:Uncharacterized protein n=1 Tax=Fusarium longipes TaxID=694270 RepID=A0A395TAB0_9HYPO|nr:hypothetical protein FLONG3_592 [Fusarium longipes]